jgi:hypothetical protein
MRTLVAYYSNTGNTRKVAEALARELQAELGEITCPRYLKWYGPLAMAWDIFTRNIPQIDGPAASASYDLVVVGGPVWAAQPAPPVLRFLNAQSGRGRVGLFVTCKGTDPASPPERAIAEMTDALAAGPVKTEIFREADVVSGSFAARAATFARSLSSLADAA